MSRFDVCYFEDPAMPQLETRGPCPFCGEDVDLFAVQCPACLQRVGDYEGALLASHPETVRHRQMWRRLAPIDRSRWAIAAGYLGLLAWCPFFLIPWLVLAFTRGLKLETFQGIYFVCSHLNAALGGLAVVTGFVALRRLRHSSKIGRGRALFGIIGGVAGALLFAVLDWLGLLSLSGR